MANATLDSCLNACLLESANLLACSNVCIAQYSPPNEVHWWQIAAGIILLMLSALFSGLTLGLLSLDVNGLEIVIAGGTPIERQHALTILPLRKRGNLLLCTLLLGNTTVNSFFAILSADLTSGLLGALLSTFFIVILGEIVPQALCSRYALTIGAHTVFLVRFFRAVMFPLAWPISKMLDLALGAELGTVYNKNELVRLVELTANSNQTDVTPEDKLLLSGVLKFANKQAEDVMTSIEKVFMLEERTRLDVKTCYEIYKSGFTRVPIYRDIKDNITGVLFVKDLILIDPADCVPIEKILQFYGSERRGNTVLKVPPQKNLQELLGDFERTSVHLVFVTLSASPKGRRVSHHRRGSDAPSAGQSAGQSDGKPSAIAIRSKAADRYNLLSEQENDDNHTQSTQIETVVVDVTGNTGKAYNGDNPQQSPRHSNSKCHQEVPKIVGIVTLEDVIEELIQADITDESDALRKRDKSRRPLTKVSDIFRYLKMFHGDVVNRTSQPSYLSTEEITAISSFLGDNISQFAPVVIHPMTLKQMLIQSEVLEYDAEDLKRSEIYLYRKAQETMHCTVVLRGKITVVAGNDNFLSEAGPWTVLGATVLQTERYISDFNAKVVLPSRLVRIPKQIYADAVRATELQHHQ
eukprot:GILJ01007783.1.p1 GENE.GILJ01007783.1~~GILJ01007783.1.p1  ORF type:complete len:638 (-),score=89.16 GILJ01007783.1:158-2071(-)